jgi:hypothetical protein
VQRPLQVWQGTGGVVDRRSSSKPLGPNRPMKFDAIGQPLLTDRRRSKRDVLQNTGRSNPLFEKPILAVRLSSSAALSQVQE